MEQSCSDLNNVRQVAGSCDVWLGKTAEDWGCELCQDMNVEKSSEDRTKWSDAVETMAGS
jgi:hypothetical protein